MWEKCFEKVSYMMPQCNTDFLTNKMYRDDSFARMA